MTEADPIRNWRRIWSHGIISCFGWFKRPRDPLIAHDDEKIHREMTEELLRTIRRVMLTLVGFSFFCWLTLGAPDVGIIDAAAKIKIPFANVRINYVAFLAIGPLVTIAIWIYLQVFVGLLEAVRESGKYEPHLPFIFTIRGTIPAAISRFLLYWLAPLTVALFAFKALPRAESPMLVALAAALFAIMFWLQIARKLQNEA